MLFLLVYGNIILFCQFKINRFTGHFLFGRYDFFAEINKDYEIRIYMFSMFVTVYADSTIQ